MSQIHSPTKDGALTPEDLDRLLERVFRKPTPPPEYPKQFCDWDKVIEHKICMGFDSAADTWMMSVGEMRRAEKVGAIWREDENGNRLT